MLCRGGRRVGRSNCIFHPVGQKYSGLTKIRTRRRSRRQYK
ncbi:hypothetical protein NEIPOLOT_00071 [Neisseria polysaccharea ATCC 43768]|nr:hypothetical protein NEIPOLOT_00071 [Neisseria polysaccharea ATCC 43768]